MHVAEIKANDVGNGEGIRVSVFVSGCRNMCEGCFNKCAWDFNYGELYTPEIEQYIIDSLEPNYIKGLSILGGDPMEEENQETVCNLINKVKTIFPNKDIWLWTGYKLGELSKKKNTQYLDKILSNVDYIVDGRFILKEKDLTLRFRGSKNQKIWHRVDNKFVQVI